MSGPRPPLRFSRRPRMHVSRAYSAPQISVMKQDILRLKRKTKSKEVLKYDNNSSSTPNASTGTIVHLTAIAEGDGESNRTGNQVYQLSTVVRGAIAKHASATTTRVRILLVKQKTNSTPAFNGVLAGGGIDYMKSVDFGKLSTIVYDKTYLLHSYKPSVNLFAKSKGKFKVKFSGNAGTDVSHNNLYLMMISDQATNTPTVDYYWRVNYYDK